MDTVDRLRSFVQEAYGIEISREKDYLITSRLMPVMSRFKLLSLCELWDAIRSQRHGLVEKAFIDAVTTRETYWFRDPRVFELLQQKIVPDLILSRPLPLRIWSAGCSSGQEPYSIALCLKKMEMAGFRTEVRILGSDISPEALDRARAGTYTLFEMERGLCTVDRQNFFAPVGNMYQINSTLRQNIEFKQFNLISGLIDQGDFDIIFCRNVLMYFDENHRNRVISCLFERLVARGFLIFGNAERPDASFQGRYEFYAPNIYRKTA